MKKASAIVTNKRGRTCHAAIVVRELGVPTIVGCGNATDLLKERQEITISCAEGQGITYNGVINLVKEEYHPIFRICPVTFIYNKFILEFSISGLRSGRKLPERLLQARSYLSGKKLYVRGSSAWKRRW